jgi:hypothetical protein
MLDLPDHADVQVFSRHDNLGAVEIRCPRQKAGEAMAAKSRPGDGQHARGRKGGSRLGPEVHVGGVFKSVVLLVKGIVTR